VHEQALEAEGVGGQAQPQQVALDAALLAPDQAQELGARGHLDAHQGLDALGIALAVDAAADAANALGHIAHLLEILGLGQALQAAVDEADGGDGVDDGLVLHDQVKVQRLGQDRVLRPEGDDGLLSHGPPPGRAASAPARPPP